MRGKEKRRRAAALQSGATDVYCPPHTEEGLQMELWSRRKFFLTSLAGSAVASAGKLFGRSLPIGSDAKALASLAPAAQGKRPLIISSANGLHALDKGMDILKKGGDTLDAAVAAVTIVEDDPNDDSVGYGGLPNEEGEVELDASVMHGPTRRLSTMASAASTFLAKNRARSTPPASGETTVRFGNCSLRK